MCIAIPMQVVSVREGFVIARGRGELRELCTALIDAVQPGDWVLAFLDSARERISAERAAEVDGVLDLLAGALVGQAGGPPGGEAGFTLPSAMSPAELARLSGAMPGSQPLS